MPELGVGKLYCVNQQSRRKADCHLDKPVEDCAYHCVHVLLPQLNSSTGMVERQQRTGQDFASSKVASAPRSSRALKRRILQLWSLQTLHLSPNLCINFHLTASDTWRIGEEASRPLRAKPMYAERLQQ